MTLRIPDHIVWQDVPGDLALFDTQRGVYHALNGSAAAIWRVLAAGIDPATIAHRLAEQHAAPLEAIASDVAAFLADARANALLVDQPE